VPRAASSRAPERRSAVPAPLRRGRVLVVDDDTSIAHAVSRALSSAHEVVIATSAAEARAALGDGNFDVILCDLMMPDETGMDLYAAVVRDRPALGERFVFMTAGVFSRQAREFLERVPNERVDKPFELKALRELVRHRVQ